MCVPKDKIQQKIEGDYQYTFRDTYVFKDGGEIFVDFKMKQDGKYRPILFVVPGLTSTSQSCYVRGIVDRAVKDGYDVIVFNYRGLAGAKLKTP